MADTIPAVLESFDDRFAAIRGDECVERLWTGGRWLEGPVYVASGKYLLFSDIPNDRMLRWDETDGSVSVFRAPAKYTNGHTLDRQGRLVSCEQGARRVTRTELDGSVTVLADRWNGKRLNSPNDAVVGNDGAVWFTDPPYGILNDYEGHRADPEVDGCHVYRIDPADGSLTAVATDFERPNGLAFSPDQRLLYVADTRRNHVRAFDVDGAALSGGDVLCDNTYGVVDGVRVDVDGRIWVAAGKGISIYEPAGTLLGRIVLPEVVSNLVFGGPKRHRIFVTASTSLYSMMLTVNGAWQL